MRAALVALGLTGCSALFGLDNPTRIDAASGDASTDTMTDASPDGLLGTWGAPEIAFVGLDGDDDPSLTEDMLEMYFNRTGDIYVTTRATLTSPWTNPIQVMELSAPEDDSTPEVTLDGLQLVLSSNRAGSQVHDLWVASRSNRSSPWGTPTIFSTLNTSAEDSAGSRSADGLEMVYSSTQAGGAGDFDVYLASRTSSPGPFPTFRRLVNLGTVNHDGSPFITADKSAVYLDSNRAGTMGDLDLYVSKLVADYEVPTPVTELNSAALDADPWVSPDGHHMYFTSNRDGTTRIYHATR